MILATTFTSAPDLAADLYPWIPARWLLRYRYDTESYLQSVHSPVLIAQSPQDGLMPFAYGKALYDAAPQPRRFVELRGDHNALFWENEMVLAREIDRFLKQHLPQGFKPHD